jgi:glutathione S-transferase
MATIVLHQWEMSPFCNKTRRCLGIKGLKYEVKDYNGLLARKAAALTPVGKLPVLEYDGQLVPDSSRIAAFLDQRHPDKPLYPKDREALASARLWEDWAGQSLYFYQVYFRMLDPVSMERALDIVCKGRPSWERAVLKFVFQRRYPKKLKQQGLARQPRGEVEQQFFLMLSDMDALLSRRPWLVAGDALSIADLSAVAMISELVRTSDLAPRVLALQNLKAWYDRCNRVAQG